MGRESATMNASRRQHSLADQSPTGALTCDGRVARMGVWSGLFSGLFPPILPPSQTYAMPPRREPSTRAVKPATAAATTTRTRTRAATNPPNPDDLADNLATNLTVADPKGKARARVPVAPRATTSRATRAPTRTASKSGSSEVTGLTQAFAGKLAITEQAPTKSQEERCQEAMRLVNTASRGLSEIAESGWKFGSSASATSKSKSSDKTPVIAGHYKTAMASLVTLREFRPDDVDIERAASSIVGKLLSMEMVSAPRQNFVAKSLTSVEVRRCP